MFLFRFNGKRWKEWWFQILLGRCIMLLSITPFDDERWGSSREMMKALAKNDCLFFHFFTSSFIQLSQFLVLLPLSIILDIFISHTAIAICTCTCMNCVSITILFRKSPYLWTAWNSDFSLNPMKAQTRTKFYFIRYYYVP